MFSTNQQLGTQIQDRLLGLKVFQKFKLTVTISIKRNIAYPNNERSAAQALKAPDPNRRAASRDIICPWKAEQRLLPKADTENETSHPLNKLPTILATVQPDPYVDNRLKTMTLI